MVDIEKNSNYIMAHLDDFLYGDKTLFDYYVSFDVLYEVKRKLKKEFKELLFKIQFYKESGSFDELNKYREAMKDLKNLIVDFDLFINEYSKQHKKRKSNIISSKTNSSSKMVVLTDRKKQEDDQQITSLIDNTKLMNILFGLKDGVIYSKDYVLTTMEGFTAEQNKLFLAYAKDILRYMFRRTSKNNLELRSTIKKQFLMFNNIFLPSEYEEQIDTSLYYDILLNLLGNDCNYLYIKQLLESIYSFKMARKDDKHILIEILDRFIYNYKLKLANQNFDFIEPAFYKEIIKMFFDGKFELQSKDKKMFEELLNNFRTYHLVTKGIHQDVIEDIKEIENVYYGFDTENNETLFDLALLENFEQSNKRNIKQTVAYYYNKGVNVKKAFAFNKYPNLAFSLTYLDDGNIGLDIHLLDTSKIFDKDSEYFDLVKDSRYHPLKFKLNEIYPTLTFSCFLYNNKFNGIAITSNIVKVCDLYGEKDLDSYRENIKIKEMIRVFNALNQKIDLDINFYKQEGIKDFSEKIISNYLINFFKKEGIPFIYEDYLDSDDDLIRRNHNSMCNLLFKLPDKKEAHHIFNIIDCHSESYYVPVSRATSKIELDTNTFLGFYLLDTIHRFQEGKYDSMEEIENVEDLLEKLNANRTYLPRSVTRENKIKLKRLRRDIKKIARK